MLLSITELLDENKVISLMSAEELYQELSNQMNRDYLLQIANYYRSWEGQNLVDLKFRFIKIVARRVDDPSILWFSLHHLANKRRITNAMLPDLIRSVIDDHIFPLRIFQSATEWLAPNEVWTSQTPRIIRSGFIPFESDESLEISLETARELSDLVENPVFIYSGNKSIHTWLPITHEGLSDQEISYADAREKAERKMRFNYYKSIESKVTYPLDNRISSDPRRVVPMPNTLNAFTGRKVIRILHEELPSISVEEIRKKATIRGWKPLKSL